MRVKTKDFLLSPTMYWAKTYTNGDELSNPKEMWDEQCKFFEQKTVSNKVYTLMQLYGLHMKRGTHIQDHLRWLDELDNQPAAIGEAIWLHQLLVDLRVNTKSPIEILQDNQSAMAKNPLGHKELSTLILGITLSEKPYKLEQLISLTIVLQLTRQLISLPSLCQEYSLRD